jgi:GDP-mannose transporter
VAIVGYSLCSSTLLLANKLAMVHLPSPSVVSFIQIFSSAITVLLLKFGGVKIDDFEWGAFKAYALYTVAFVAAIYTNMQALQASNVETVIVFRACSPIAVGLVEYLFLDRARPSLRSMISLLTVAFGALVYCMCDSEFAMNGFKAYYWAMLYFVLIVVEMTYGKMITSSVKMDSVWGPVLYCNVLAALPMFLLGYCSGEYENISEKFTSISTTGMLILLFSCITGTLIGYTGWLCRGMVSATTYTLVGVVNKFVTVLLNIAIWDKHSSPIGLFAVCLCLLAGSAYQQAPRRDEAHKQETELKANSAAVAGTDIEDTSRLLEAAVAK